MSRLPAYEYNPACECRWCRNGGTPTDAGAGEVADPFGGPPGNCPHYPPDSEARLRGLMTALPYGVP